jgi:hypothetical protein
MLILTAGRLSPGFVAQRLGSGRGGPTRTAAAVEDQVEAELVPAAESCTVSQPSVSQPAQAAGNGRQGSRANAFGGRSMGSETSRRAIGGIGSGASDRAAPTVVEVDHRPRAVEEQVVVDLRARSGPPRGRYPGQAEYILHRNVRPQ